MVTSIDVKRQAAHIADLAAIIARAKQAARSPDVTDDMTFAEFCERTYVGYQRARHIDLIVETLQAAIDTPNSRTIITMPPRHSKSVHVSELLPAYALGRVPTRRVIAASHMQSLADMFSRRVRNRINGPRWPFRTVRVARDKGAVQRWDIEGTDGGYVAVGRGGAPTGEGAHVMLVDDPIRNAAEAESQTVRDMLWEWWQGTMYTRLEPGGSIVVTACMTGDTQVLRPDGTTTALQDIRIGDEIATYEHGEITTAHVTNWIKHRPDSVYIIKTISGRTIRANARHPFLVQRGDDRQWVRLRHLKPGDCLIGIACEKERIRASSALTTDATSPQSVKGCATRITTRHDGRQACALHQSITNHDAQRNSSDDTASPSQSMTRCSQRSTDDVRSAESNPRPIRETCRPIERTDACSSITVTTPATSEDCCATIAISQSDTATRLNCSCVQRNTYAIAPDEIVSITPDGVEPVYDITVERTENFIADGVVSHNTRWHEDDLTGRLLDAEKRGGEKWTHLHLPAICDSADDPLGRAIGEALWPERYDEARLAIIRDNVGARVWNAQYQGRPTPDTGAIIDRNWWRYYAERPSIDAFDRIIQSWDMTFKKTDTGSYIVGQVWGTIGADRYLLDQVRFRGDFPAAVAAVRSLSEAWPMTTEKIVEDKANGPAIVSTLRGEIPGIIEVSPEGGKVARANAVAWQIESGNVYLPTPVEHAWVHQFVEECSAFPNGVNDDQVDAMTQALARLHYRGPSFSDNIDDFLAGTFGG